MQERLNVLKNSVDMAARMPERAKTCINVGVVEELYQHEDHSRMLLQPFLHGARCAPAQG